MIVTTLAYASGSEAVSTSAVNLASFSGLDAALVSQADRARITASNNAVRYRYDGVNPSASVGHYLAADSEVVITGKENIARLSFIRAGSGDAVVFVTLEKL